MNNLTKESVLKAYKEGTPEIKNLLKTLCPDYIQPENVMERIKTFEDALRELGEQDENVKILLAYNGINRDMIAAQAHMKLTLIARVLNEGWIPDWTNNNEYKYYPWFDMSSGSGLSFLDYGTQGSHSACGSRLCFKTRGLAKYAGEQFNSIYKDLFII